MTGTTISRAGWITRRRLVERAADAPVVVLAAPGGWGKTTLAAQLAVGWSAALVAVRLDADADPHAVVAALRRGLRRAGVTDLAELAPDRSPDEVADALLGALTQRTDPVALLVDEVQRLTPSAAAWLRAFADDLPAPHRVVIAGRSIDRALVRRPGHGWVKYGVDDLRFTADEVTELLDGADREDVEGVVAGTEGWPVAVALAVAGSLSDPGDRRSGRVIDVLLDDVLGADRARLGALGRLPLLDPVVCEIAAGTGSFETLVASGVPMRRSGRWWSLADPVRDTLAAGSSPLDSRTATIVAGEYELHTGVRFLLDAGEHDALIELLGRRHWSELNQFAAPELDALLTAAQDASSVEPEALARALLNAARSAEMVDPGLRRAWIGRGIELVEPGTDVSLELRAEAVLDQTGRADPAALDEARSLLQRLPPMHRARPRLLLTVGIVNAFRGGPDELVVAERAFTEAAALLAASGETRWQAEALKRLAFMVSYHGGRIALAAEQQAAALALLTPGARDWAVAMTYYADILDTLGRSAEAAAAASEAYEYGRRVGDAVATGYGAWSLAIVAAHRHDADETRRWLDEVERSPGNWAGEVPGQEFLAFGADLLGGLGDRAGAAVYRDRCAARVGDGGTQSLVDVVDGRLEAMYGDPRRAIELFERLDDEPYATIRTKWVRMLFRALAGFRLGERVEATKWIERALAVAETMGLPDLPHRHEPTLVAMLAPVWPGGAGPAVTARVTALGGFAVIRGSEIVTPAPGNPATLVKLLALRGTLTAEQVIDQLWPEADVTTGRSRLRNLLNRVRSQSGELVVRDGEMLRLAADVESDLARFDELVEATLTAEPDDRAGLARVALTAYGGELLPGDAYEDWAAGPRERVRRRLLSLLDLVADDALERGDVDEAMRLLDTAIEREPLEEVRYVRAAEALLAAGRTAAAREVIARGANSLDEIGVRPSAAFAAISATLDDRRT